MIPRLTSGRMGPASTRTSPIPQCRRECIWVWMYVLVVVGHDRMLLDACMHVWCLTWCRFGSAHGESPKWRFCEACALLFSCLFFRFFPVRGCFSVDPPRHSNALSIIPLDFSSTLSHPSLISSPSPLAHHHSTLHPTSSTGPLLERSTCHPTRSTHKPHIAYRVGTKTRPDAPPSSAVSPTDR